MKETPLYKPACKELSPREMYKDELEAKKPKPLQIKKPVVLNPVEKREQFAGMSPREKAQKMTAIVMAPTWRDFLRPYLESLATRKPRFPKNETDYYTVLKEMAVEEFVHNLIANMEAQATEENPHE